MRSSMYSQLNDQDWLREQVSQGFSASQIAAKVGCHRQAVNRSLTRLDLTAKRGFRRHRYMQLEDAVWLAEQVKTKPLRQIAEEIGSSYSAIVHAVRKHGIEVPHRSSHRFNPQKSANIKAGLKNRYPNGRFGSDASNWRGGKWKGKDGYIWSYAPEHPRAIAKNRKHVQEHILVMEKKLGRYLEPGEEVNHKNMDKGDNRPDNLELQASRKAHQTQHWAEIRESARLRDLLVSYGIDPEERKT